MFLNLLTKTREVPIDEAALYAFLGFLVVFVGISFLIVIVWLVGKLVSVTSNTQSAPQPKQTPIPVSVANSDELDEETVAVITAALMAYYQTNNPKCEFRVKRIKRI